MTFVLLYHYQQQEIALQKLEESFANLPQQKKLKRDKAAFVEKQKKALTYHISKRLCLT